MTSELPRKVLAAPAQALRDHCLPEILEKDSGAFGEKNLIPSSVPSFAACDEPFPSVSHRCLPQPCVDPYAAKGSWDQAGPGSSANVLAGGKQINMQEAWLLEPQGALGLSWESVLDVPHQQG